MGKTVFVLGAGSGVDIGFPDGAALKSQIAEILNISYRMERRESGDALVDEALRVVESRDLGAHSLRNLGPACWKIRDAMPQAISIDNFIEAHRGDRDIETCGKIAIAHAILGAEANSALRVHADSEKPRIDFPGLSKTWQNSLFQLLTENLSATEVGIRLTDTSFIIFNYDRALEHFLWFGLQNYYAIDANEASSLLSEASFFHPYGTVGVLPWQSVTRGIPYGAKPNAHALAELASGIRTFSEGTDPATSNIEQIRETLKDAEMICFLGFAFHKQNLDLMQCPRRERTDAKIVGTALGISDTDLPLVKTKVAECLDRPFKMVLLDNKLRCDGLFHEYWRTLSFT